MCGRKLQRACFDNAITHIACEDSIGEVFTFSLSAGNMGRLRVRSSICPVTPHFDTVRRSATRADDVKEGCGSEGTTPDVFIENG
jgi:hypothetical protein